jgi:hypothetical protein
MHAECIDEPGEIHGPIVVHRARDRLQGR